PIFKRLKSIKMGKLIQILNNSNERDEQFVGKLSVFNSMNCHIKINHVDAATWLSKYCRIIILSAFKIVICKCGSAAARAIKMAPASWQIMAQASSSLPRC